MVLRLEILLRKIAIGILLHSDYMSALATPSFKLRITMLASSDCVAKAMALGPPASS
jgi:hypothetical protein